jgi:hypothetical protein
MPPPFIEIAPNLTLLLEVRGLDPKLAQTLPGSVGGVGSGVAASLALLA